MAFGDGRTTPQRVGDFARADRQFARSVLLGLVLVTAVAIIGPLISYRSDRAVISSQFQTRIAREAAVYADALGLHFEMLQAELERLAVRPEVDLRDQSNVGEQLVLDVAHHHSALFKGGVGVIDSEGIPVWSEPKELFAHEGSLASRPWFQRLLAAHAPIVDALTPGSSTILVAVPVLRGGKTTGVMVGLLDAVGRAIPGGRPVGEDRTLVLVGRKGDVFLPEQRPAWSGGPAFMEELDRLLGQPHGGVTELGGQRYFASAMPVPGTGLRLLLLAEEGAVMAPAHARFLEQLVFIAVLQVLTILLFSLYLRRSYRRFLEMEAAATAHQTMAALGSAASLIAHEVKNSLNGLNAAASLLTSGADPALPARTIRGQIDRLRHLASSLLHFGKPAAAQHVTIQLDAVVREAVEGLKVLPEAEEVVVTTTLDDSIRVSCDPLLLATALDNLIRNAIEAATVAKDLGKLDSPCVRVLAGTSNGSAFVRVEDNAGGPPEGFERRLFEPFVTSKPKGIGLGLSMAKQAVERQGGSLSFERTPQGSAFTVRLPLERQA